MTASAPPLEQNDPVDLFVGASEVQGRVTLLDADRLDAGDAGWVQLRLAEPVAVVRGDRFILRRPSPSETIGGGIVVDTAPRRHRRFHAGTLERLESLRRGTPEDLARQLLAGGPREVREVVAAMGLEPAAAHPVIMALIGGGELLVLPPVTDTLPPTRLSADGKRRGGIGIAPDGAARELPRREPAQARDAARGGEIAPRACAPACSMSSWRISSEQGASSRRRAAACPCLRLPGHAVALPPAQRAAADALLAALAREPFAPPDPATLGVGPETLAVLAEEGSIVRVAEGIVFSRDAYDRMVAETLALIDAHGSVTLAQFRDAVGTTRKYAQAVMEYLDARRITRRVGDTRVRGPAAREIAPRAE